MKKEEIMQCLEEFGVLQEGHFLLSSGLHSDKYLQCAQVLQYPEQAEKLGAALAQKFSDQKIDLVVGPALGGVVLAHEVARSIGCRGIFAERKDGRMQLRRGFSIEPGSRVLIVEDVVTTGKSALEVVEVVKNESAEIVGLGSIVDRSPKDINMPVPFQALLRVEVEIYSPGECPLCEQGLSLVKPGSRESKN